MAAVKRLVQTDYTIADQGLQDHIIDVFGTRENGVDLFRPALADQHKVGFFTLDRCSQTEVTEVVDLKEMTEIIQILLQDVTTLRRDINFAKHVMQADYESKLQEKAYQLYCRINEKVLDLEKTHEERVATVRRAFRQQLSDAIARVAVLYNKNLETKMKREKSRRAGEQSKLDVQYQEMKATIIRNEQLISMLRLQLQQYQQPKQEELENVTPSDQLSNATPSTPLSPQSSKKKLKKKAKPRTPSPPSTASSRKSKSPTPIPPSPSPPPLQQSPSPKHSPKPPQKPQAALLQPPVEELSVKSKSPEINPELEELRETVSDMETKMDKLKDTVDKKTDENTALSEEIKVLKEAMEKEKNAAEKLRKEHENMIQNAQQEQASSKKMEFGVIEPDTLIQRENEKRTRTQPDFSFLHEKDISFSGFISRKKIERQKQEMERMMKEQLRLAKEEALMDARDEAEKNQNAEKDKMKLLMDQKKLLEEQLMREKRKAIEKSKEDLDAEKMRRNEQKLRDEIQRLKNEIEKVHRTWEKKFAILQQSLHALKDESYVRQTLQRQAAALHHAAVSYAADTPMGISPASKPYHSTMRKAVIPEIPKTKSPAAPGPSQSGTNPADKDYISYTVSAPSGRGTAMMSVDENQVMSEGDQQDIPEDTEILPDPPRRRSRNRDEGSRHSSQSHVVVVPSQAS